MRNLTKNLGHPPMRRRGTLASIDESVSNQPEACCVRAEAHTLTIPKSTGGMSITAANYDTRTNCRSTGNPSGYLVWFTLAFFRGEVLRCPGVAWQADLNHAGVKGIWDAFPEVEIIGSNGRIQLYERRPL